VGGASTQAYPPRVAHFTFDPTASTLLLRTRAKGLFSKLAHDLELRCERVSGEGDRDGESETWRGRMTVPVDGIKVVGSIKKGKPDASALAGWEMELIEKRLREEVFAGVREVVVAASGKLSRGDLEISVGGRGQSKLALVEFRDARAGIELRAKGDVSISRRQREAARRRDQVAGARVQVGEHCERRQKHCEGGG
jgi:hypothetical protein